MRNLVKRSLGVLLGSAILLSSAACSSGNPAPSSGGAAAPSTAASQAAASAPAPAEKQIVVWGWLENDFNEAKAEFAKLHPEYEMTFVPVQAADYTKKIQTTLASGSQMPDIGWLDVALRGKLYSLNIWENLESEPYKLDRTKIESWLYPFLEDDKGNICSLTWDTGIAGMAYKRPLAKEYFGTDDPKELEAMFPDWDAFIKKGVEVGQRSGGKIKMFAALDEMMTLIGHQNAIPFAKDGKANIEETLGRAIDVGIKARDNDIVGKLDLWSPAWNAEFALETSIFNICAEWAPSANIKPNDAEGEGTWGLMVPPEGCINQGGTSLGIPTDAKNKQGAWDFLQWNLLSEEGVTFNRDHRAVNVHIAEFGADFFKNEDPFFGGEDLGNFYYKEALPKISIRPLGLWDLEYNQIITITAKAIMQDKALTYDKILEKAATEAQNIVKG